MPETKKLRWTVHVPNFFQEIMLNKELWIMRAPMQIFQNILLEVATRASELNDPIMNALMMRLALYDIADPQIEGYDSKFINDYIEKAYEKKGSDIAELPKKKVYGVMGLDKDFNPFWVKLFDTESDREAYIDETKYDSYRYFEYEIEDVYPR